MRIIKKIFRILVKIKNIYLLKYQLIHQKNLKKNTQKKFNRKFDIAKKIILNKKKIFGSSRKTVGIFLAEHLGDILACEPVIPWLKNEFPDGIIIWLTKRNYSEIMRFHPQIDLVIEIDSITACGEIIRSGILDHVVDLHLQGKPCVEYGHKHLKEWGNPEVNIENYYNYGSLLQAMSVGGGLPKLDAQPRLFLSPGVKNRVDRLNLPEKYIVLHTTSNENTRNWDAIKWNELTDRIIDNMNFSVIEIGLSALIEDRNGMINLCGKLSLMETSEVIRRAKCFIGVDSGPAHIANGLEVPSVILLGKYRIFNRYMPYSGFLKKNAELMLIQWVGAASEIPLSEVLQRLGVLLNKI